MAAGQCRCCSSASSRSRGSCARGSSCGLMPGRPSGRRAAQLLQQLLFELVFFDFVGGRDGQRIDQADVARLHEAWHRRLRMAAHCGLVERRAAHHLDEDGDLVFIAHLRRYRHGTDPPPPRPPPPIPPMKTPSSSSPPPCAGIGTAATARTPGCLASNASTSKDDTFSPRTRHKPPMRSTKAEVWVASAIWRQASPVWNQQLRCALTVTCGLRRYSWSSKPGKRGRKASWPTAPGGTWLSSSSRIATSSTGLARPMKPLGSGWLPSTSSRPEAWQLARYSAFERPFHSAAGVPVWSPSSSMTQAKPEPDSVCPKPQLTKSMPKRRATSLWLTGSGCMCTLLSVLARSPGRGAAFISHGIITSSKMQLLAPQSSMLSQNRVGLKRSHRPTVLPCHSARATSAKAPPTWYSGSPQQNPHAPVHAPPH